MRFVGVIRLSVGTDESNSPERQRQVIETWAAAQGHDVIGWAEDIDVSGKVEPARRPGLGPWLQRLDDWDGLVVTKPDRIGRSLRDFLNLWHEFKEQGKDLVSIEPKLDFSTPDGEFHANILLSAAQYERQLIAGRVKDAFYDNRVKGLYTGGQVPFGYRAVRAFPRGWRYIQDPDYAPVVLEICDRLLRGDSMRQVASWLNAEGIPTGRNVMRLRNGKEPDGSLWHQATVKELIMHPSIAGLQASAKQVLRGPDGMTVQRCEGILNRATWEKVKMATTGPAHRPGLPARNSALLGVAFCGVCFAPLHLSGGVSKGKRYSYYRCQRAMKPPPVTPSNPDAVKCASRPMKVDDLEETFEFELLRQVGDVERVERIFEAGEDHTDELERVEEAIAELRADRYERGLFRGERGAEEYASVMSSLEDRREELEAMPRIKAGYRLEKTGQTYRDYWAMLEPAERRQWMLTAGIRGACRKLTKDEAGEMFAEMGLALQPGWRARVMVLFDMPALDELRRMAAEA